MTKKYKLPAGTWIERDLFNSKAFINLTGFAPQLLILFYAKRQFENTGGKSGKKKRICLNHDNLTFTQIEAKKTYGVNSPRFLRAIDQLLEKGFIKIIHYGGAYQKDKTIYGLSENWRLWQPGMIVEERKKRTVQRGYCKPGKKITTNETVPIHTNENVPIRGVLG